MTVLGAAEFLGLFRRGAISAEGHVNDLLGRIAENQELNVFTWFAPSQVLEAARAADARRARGEPLGRLAGLPLIVKDNINTVGFPTSAGTRALKAFHPSVNAPVWQRLADEGALLLGKANMHELAAGSTSSNPVFGVVRNPHARAHIPGGSSGGTAAAIAAGLAPAGLGTDTVGSVRAPSCFCGIAGLRPTTAETRAYSPEGVVPLTRLFDTIGPMAASVADLVPLHEVITGATVPSLASAGLRIGLSMEPFWTDLDPQVERVVRAARDQLAAAGMRFVPLDLGDLVARATALHGKILGLGAAADIADFLTRQQAPVSLEAVIAGIASQDVRTRLEAEPAGGFDPDEVRAELRGLREEFGAQLRGAGVAAIMYPTAPILPPLIRPEGDRADDTMVFNGREVSSAFTPVRHSRYAAGLGIPALTIPAGRTASLLPAGLEFAAPAHDDSLLLGVGLAAEAALG